MNYKKLFNFSGHDSRGVDQTQIQTMQIDEVKQKQDVSNEKLDTIIRMINDINENHQTYENDEQLHTVLNDEETRYIIEYMVGIHEKYFPEYPLSTNLEPEFIWNLPKTVVNLSKKLSDYGYSDMINPLFWLYVFCVDIDEFIFAKIIRYYLEEFDSTAYNHLMEIIEANEAYDVHEGDSNNEK